MSTLKWIKYADEEGNQNVAIISSSWCMNRSGICLSFAIPIEVMSINEITDFGDQFQDAVRESYNDLLNNYFYPKTETPIICSTDKGEIIMMWSFQGEESKSIKQELKKNGIKEIKYE